jgi:xylan 1,4-beta-xylosidase
MSPLTGAQPSAPAPSSDSRSHRVVAPDRLHVRPAWSGPRTPFRHTWEGVINVDQFRWMVRRDLQDQLALIQRELHAKHVRAVGMFDDELRAFCPSPGSFMGYESKEPRTNWQNIDYVIDSLLDRGLHPMFTTSFIPSAMASGPVTVFTTKGHTSPPRDWAQWEIFVRESVQHAVDRYSLAVVREWYFEVWNEPNLPGWFWGGTHDDFHRLWQTTHRAIKSVDARLRVGGPSAARGEWIDELLAFAADHDCTPDYLTTHVYNNDSPAGQALAPFDGAQVEKNNRSADQAAQLMRATRARVDRAGFRGELHWNEWGRSFHGIDTRREHPSEAAFIARLLGDVSQEADAFAYWCVSDIYDQVGFGREAFHGGYGLLSLQGLRKPAYHAFQLLSRLGTARVAATGEGLDTFRHAIVTAPVAGRAHALIYAYDHADTPATVSLAVAVDLPPGATPTALYRVDSTENNVLTRWRSLGSPAYLSREQTRDLAAVDALTPSTSPLRLESTDNRRTAHFTMESPGLALLEIATPASVARSA